MTYPRFIPVFLSLSMVLRAQDLNVYRGTQVPPAVEKIYEHGLRYLVQSQSEEGGFSGGQYGTEPATPALAMLAMFAHGEDPNYGPYAKSIKKCLDFLLKNADAQTGYIGSSMYNHGFSNLSLAEAYGAVQDDPHRSRVEKSRRTHPDLAREKSLQSVALLTGRPGR